jgi:hypothetical protein
LCTYAWDGDLKNVKEMLEYEPEILEAVNYKCRKEERGTRREEGGGRREKERREEGRGRRREGGGRKKKGTNDF